MSNAQVRFVSPGRVELDPRPIPAPGRAQVLIRTICSLISTGTETTLLGGADGLGGTWSTLASYPATRAIATWGGVVECGSSVDAGWRGRLVSSHAPHGAWVTMAVDELRPVPDGVDAESAAFTTIAEVALNGLRRGAITWGERAVVLGLGLVGQVTARALALAGVRPVVGIDRARPRLGRLPTTGSFVPIHPDDGELLARLRAATGGELCDAAFEVSGCADAIHLLPPLLREQGRLVVLSSPVGETRFDFHDACNRTSLSIIGAHYFSHPPRATPDAPWSAKRHAEIFLGAVARGDIEVASLVTHRVPAARAGDAYRALIEDREATLAVILDWREGWDRA
ncbi:MAG: zinc-binding alcohol dehydrogenase [Deltaproteobacteria bacterium]|nr:zinc-binding alcohol dehydrogenase [Deltaproteobacteria bacterium]